jgi:hypothetical protein
MTRAGALRADQQTYDRLRENTEPEGRCDRRPERTLEAAGKPESSSRCLRSPVKAFLILIGDVIDLVHAILGIRAARKPGRGSASQGLMDQRKKELRSGS